MNYALLHRNTKAPDKENDGLLPECVQTPKGVIRSCLCMCER